MVAAIKNEPLPAPCLYPQGHINVAAPPGLASTSQAERRRKCVGANAGESLLKSAILGLLTSHEADRALWPLPSTRESGKKGQREGVRGDFRVVLTWCMQHWPSLTFNLTTTGPMKTVLTIHCHPCPMKGHHTLFPTKPLTLALRMPFLNT